MKRQAINWGKICSVFDEGLLFRICKEVFQYGKQAANLNKYNYV